MLLQILERPDVWRGDALARAPLPGVPTGFAELDRELPGGGWPRGCLTELLPARRGVGELSLLLPVLARLSSDELAWLVCVAPPHPLYAPALHAGGVDLSRLLVASAPGRDAAWACERSLAADGVGAVIAWLPEARQRHCVACSLLPRPVVHYCSFFARWLVPVIPRQHRCASPSKGRASNSSFACSSAVAAHSRCPCQSPFNAR
jgi:hypothetical protein